MLHRYIYKYHFLPKFKSKCICTEKAKPQEGRCQDCSCQRKNVLLCVVPVVLAWGLQDIFYCWNVYFENITQRVKSSHEIEFCLWRQKGHGFTQVGSSVKVQKTWDSAVRTAKHCRKVQSCYELRTHELEIEIMRGLISVYQYTRWLENSIHCFKYDLWVVLCLPLLC